MYAVVRIGSYNHNTQKELALISDAQRDFVCEYFKQSYEVLNIDTNIQLVIKLQSNKEGTK